jgi:hypothetical protein
MHEAAFYDCIAHELPVRGRRNRTPLAECTVRVKKILYPIWFVWYVVV